MLLSLRNYDGVSCAPRCISYCLYNAYRFDDTQFDDNLADVYLRLSSLHDQTRFSAVCTSWRAVRWWHPAPLAPALLPWTDDSHRKRGRRTRAYDLEAGGASRVPLPWFARGKRLVGAYDGGWVAAMSNDYNIHQAMIVNLSSGAQLKLSAKQRIVACTCEVEYTRSPDPACTGVEKVIFSDYPDSPSGCILAAITVRFRLAVCKLGSPDNGWITPNNNGRTPQGLPTDMDKELIDIAFCKGKYLYGLARHSWEVFKFDVAVDADGALEVTSIPFTCIKKLSVNWSAVEVAYQDRYIFELHGKLAMASEANSAVLEHSGEAPFFMAFEVDETPSGYMWTEVTSLGDHALFLGPTYSKAARVPEDQRGGLEKNHIYYSKKHRNKPNNHTLTKLGLGCLDVYCWENQAVHRSGKPAVHHQEVQSARSLKGPVVLDRGVQPLRRSLGTMITSRGYHYIDDDGCNGCIWLFLPRDL